MGDALTVVFFVLSLVPAIILHEVSHGFVANLYGDHTARDAGRLSLNPIRHVDPFGTIVLPALLLLPYLFGGGGPVFGYARPVPVDVSHLPHPERKMMWVALAGPGTNLLLALLGSAALQVAGPQSSGRAGEFFVIWVLTNVFLGVFNLLPIPPLDGSRILARFLPGRVRQAFYRLEPYSMGILLILLLVFPDRIFGVVDPIALWIVRLFAGL